MQPIAVMSIEERLLRAIPGGAHTYSRGRDQFPANAPPILERGEGAYVYAPDGRRFLDFGMALGAVGIGYAEPEIVEAARIGGSLGNGLTRPSVVELEAAERLIGLVDSVDMVKFTKNGSTAVTAAVKLARAHTGRELVARCAQHPFFSYDDWFIGSTPVQRGIPRSTISETLLFDYNDSASLERLLESNRGKVAAVVLEPATAVCPATVAGPCRTGPCAGCCSSCPCSHRSQGERHFLHEVRDLCDRHGVVMVLDEMITGFRWHLKGAQHLLGIQPDISTFGKAMANGYSVACVAGRRDLMRHGSIEFEGTERVFLLSTTHGAEMCGLSAFLATVDFMDRHDVCGHMWRWGSEFIAAFNGAADACGIRSRVRAGGPGCKPLPMFLEADGSPSFALRTLFMQEMVRNGVLMPQVCVTWRHGAEELSAVREALAATMPVLARAIDSGINGLLEGPIVKPVFRRVN
jgi:glutamate-1-semialdehyde 2,1-aminomutase